MATKLKNLKITSVDLVEQGANPDAHIKLYKSKAGQTDKNGGKNSLLERLAQKLAAALHEFLQEKEDATAMEDGITGEKAEKPGMCRERVEQPATEKKEKMPNREAESAKQTCASGEKKQPEKVDSDANVVSIDCRKLTARERKFLLELARKYETKTPEALQVAKAKAELAYIEKELARAKTMAIAKQYEILGKDAATLCDTLCDLQKSSSAGYQTLLDTLAEAKILIEKTGIFREIGKSGQQNGSGDGWGQIVKAADALQKEHPGLTRAAAIQKACEKHPQLVEDYEENL